MTDNELKQLADHMGHDLAIHNNHYRQQSAIIERTKIAELLCSIESTNCKYGLIACDKGE